MKQVLMPKPMLDSSDLLHNAVELRRRAHADGYLYFRGLLSPDRVLDLRRQIIELLVSQGFVHSGGVPGREKVIREAVEAQPPEQVIEQCMTVRLCNDIHDLEELNALPHVGELVGLHARLFGERPLLHPRVIARVILPNSRLQSDSPSRDAILIQGTFETWTAWIPLGDVVDEPGPLTLLPGSHRQGIIEAAVSSSTPWVSAKFAPGDVVTYHTLALHSGLPVRDAATVRLALEARYQPASHSIQALSLRPYYASHVAFARPAEKRPEWPDVYRGWNSRALQYYWRSFEPLNVVDFDIDRVSFFRNLSAHEKAALKLRVDDRTGI